MSSSGRREYNKVSILLKNADSYEELFKTFKDKRIDDSLVMNLNLDLIKELCGQYLGCYIKLKSIYEDYFKDPDANKHYFEKLTTDTIELDKTNINYKICSNATNLRPDHRKYGQSHEFPPNAWKIISSELEQRITDFYVSLKEFNTIDVNIISEVIFDNMWKCWSFGCPPDVLRNLLSELSKNNRRFSYNNLELIKKKVNNKFKNKKRYFEKERRNEEDLGPRKRVKKEKALDY